jgi:hypothetical protein
MYRFVVSIPLRKYWDLYFDQATVLDEFEAEFESFTITRYCYRANFWQTVFHKPPIDFVVGR